MSAPADVSSSITTSLASNALIATAVIVAGAGAAFGIKGLWIAWRAGSKAMAKTGT
jgi:hypothetical protein